MSVSRWISCRRVSEGDYVNSIFYAEVSSVVNGTQNNTLDPPTIRSASTTVLKFRIIRTAGDRRIGWRARIRSRTRACRHIEHSVIGNLFSSKNNDRQKTT